MSLIHAKKYKPRIFPIKGTGVSAEIDRLQTIDYTGTLNREGVDELGRDGNVGYLKKSPTVTYRATQYEYGSIEFWQKLVNTTLKGNIGEDEIVLNDFKTSYFDICAYLTDDDEVFKGTVWYPSLRTSGFSVTIGEPQGIIERSFDLVGEMLNIFENDNKYFIDQIETPLAGSDVAITLDKTAVLDPDDSVYMLRIMRVSNAGVTTELVKDSTDDALNYVETDSDTVTIKTITTDDTIKLYYTSSSAPDTIFTLNDADPSALVGDSCSIYLYIPASGKPSSSDYLYMLQNITMDVRFDREDVRAIGSKRVEARGIRTSTVTYTLGKILDGFSVEQVLRGEAPGYGKINIEKLSDKVAIIIKFFSDNTKNTFTYGFKSTGLSPTELRGSVGVNEYAKEDTSLEGENLIISADSSIIGI